MFVWSWCRILKVIDIFLGGKRKRKANRRIVSYFPPLQRRFQNEFEQKAAQQTEREYEFVNGNVHEISRDFILTSSMSSIPVRVRCEKKVDGYLVITFLEVILKISFNFSKAFC